MDHLLIPDLGDPVRMRRVDAFDDGVHLEAHRLDLLVPLGQRLAPFEVENAVDLKEEAPVVKGGWGYRHTIR